jgi:hypothetical protein
MATDPSTVSGMFGTAIIVVTYFTNQQGWVSSRDWRFPLANLVGALLILTSFYVAWNLPAAIIEIFWAAISVYGLTRSLLRADGCGGERASSDACGVMGAYRAEAPKQRSNKAGATVE